MNRFNDMSSTSESDVLDLSNGKMDRNNGDSGFEQYNSAAVDRH